MDTSSIGFLLAIFILIFIIIQITLFFLTYKRIEPNTAILRTGKGGTQVSFNGLFVFPKLHQHFFIDLSIKQFNTEFLGNHALLTKDKEKIEIIITTFWRVNKTLEDIVKAHESIGAVNIKDPKYVRQYFSPKVSEAVSSIVRASRHESLIEDSMQFKSQIADALGYDLNGYILDDLSIQMIRKKHNTI